MWPRGAKYASARQKRGGRVGFPVRFHDLRHAHASWLLAGGAAIQVVKERMGHANITITQKYLHTLPNADRAAVAALDAIGNRNP